MNQTQIQTTLAPLIALGAGFLAGKGVFGIDAAGWTVLIGGAVGFGATVWGVLVGRKASLVTTVAQMPEVQAVRLEPNVSQQSSIVTNTPSNVSPTA